MWLLRSLFGYLCIGMGLSMMYIGSSFIWVAWHLAHIGIWFQED